MYILFILLLLLLYKQQEQSAQAESGMARKGCRNKLMSYTYGKLGFWLNYILIVGIYNKYSYINRLTLL